MKRWPLVGVVLAVVWLFVRGVVFSPVIVVEEFIIGLGLGLPIAFVFRRLYSSEMAVFAALKGVPAAVKFVLVFIEDLIVANLDVAYRVLAPSMPIRPAVFELPLRVESDLAITTIANSITLTPGTLTMEYDEERNSLYVHTIWEDDRESVVGPIRRWEDYALRIFEEERDPGDPVPLEPRDYAFDGGAVDDD